MATNGTVRIEGGLLSPDILETITQRTGQRPADFGIGGNRSVLDEATAAWGDIRNYWLGFQSRLARQTNESPVTVTREQWVIPLLEALGYAPTYQRRAAEVDGRRYTISHRAGEAEESPPVHIIGYDEEVDKRDPSRATAMAPHALLQDYLNRSEHLWGVVTNGYRLRLLRDATHFTRPSYVEFDLQSMMAGEELDEFLLFYRLVHRTRLPEDADDAAHCLLERYHQEAIEEGGRIREGLRDAVEDAILTFANGFLAHPRNDALRDAMRSGRQSPEGLYQELLYLIYRLLFLMVAEERDLLSADADGDQDGQRAAYDTYRRHWSIGRLRALAEEPLSAPERFDDLYLGLRALCEALRSPDLCTPLGLAPLNGELFGKLHFLDDAYLNNRDLLAAVRLLSYFQPRDERVRRRVNYGALDVEELGSVYEALLDYQPLVETPVGGPPTFDFIQGTERKSTGSYYTRPELVRELIESALVPVMEARLAETDGSPEARQEALLSLTVCDPACGSGHFLLAAARRIGAELARVRAGDDEPSPDDVRLATRDAVTHCVYGVDRNPLAVDLCKVALWMEGYARGKPLTFLDYRIRCGDSLVGVFDLEVLREGIPDEAYAPVSGDDKTTAREARDRNRREREGNVTLFEAGALPIGEVLERRQALMRMPEDTPEQVRRKREAAEHLRGSAAWRQLQTACDLWTAAFFAPLESRGGDRVPTTADVRAASGRFDIRSPRAAVAQEAATRLRFFHWPLEFPEVLGERGGFDVVLGNPPWERIKLQEQEFFSGKSAAISAAPNKAARAALIARLPQTDPELWQKYATALHDADCLSLFLRGSDRFPLTARGDINTYVVFAGLDRALVGSQGRAGFIVPTGIATDNTTKDYFGDLVESGQLVSLYDFENRDALFPGVHRSYKFCLLTLSGRREDSGARVRDAEMRFAFFLTHPTQLGDASRSFALTREDFRRINPNTRTCPIFRTRADAELTRKIYRRVPVLVNEETGVNPWGVSFMAMFHMSNDSHLFRTREELEGEGYRREGNRYVRGESVYLPLYEAKMIWQFDHRFSSYEGVDSRSSTHLPDTTEAQHADACYQVLPWYWVEKDQVEAKIDRWRRDWLLGFRNVTNATNERSAIFSLIPLAAVGNSMPILQPRLVAAPQVCWLAANVSSIAFDWVVRQKLAGMNMNFFYVQQFPILSPQMYPPHRARQIVPLALELIYTAWDTKPFADDVWKEADQELCDAIEAQIATNGRATGGNRWDSAPPWVDRSVGFPPFRWDAERRAVLRAELDAYYARLYGLTRDELRYILDPQDVYGPDFPGETFRVLKEKEIRQYGEYRTRRLVLEAWDRLEET